MNLKTMKLYSQVDRIHNELRALGLAGDTPLKVSDLTPFDQYHYFGSDAVDETARVLGVGPGSRVLDIGSGIGGPARYLAATKGCSVVALEVQRDLHDTAVALTRRCDLDRTVDHVCGDVLGALPDWQPFDSIMSLLAFLHIADLPRLFDRCRGLLRANGGMFIEDFVLLKPPSAPQMDDLRLKVATPDLRDLSTYQRALVDAGFVVQSVTDMTAPWREFTARRAASFRADRGRFSALHGQEITDGLDDFYATVAGLFASGVVGGVRIHAVRAPEAT